MKVFTLFTIILSIQGIASAQSISLTERHHIKCTFENHPKEALHIYSKDGFYPSGLHDEVPYGVNIWTNFNSLGFAKAILTVQNWTTRLAVYDYYNVDIKGMHLQLTEIVFPSQGMQSSFSGVLSSPDHSENLTCN